MIYMNELETLNQLEYKLYTINYTFLLITLDYQIIIITHRLLFKIGGIRSLSHTVQYFKY